MGVGVTGYSCAPVPGGLAGISLSEPLMRLLLRRLVYSWLCDLDIGLVPVLSCGRGGACACGCRPYVTSAPAVRGLWISCRWVKPESTEPLGDPPGSGGVSPWPLAVSTLGRRSLPLWEASQPWKFVGPGDDGCSGCLPVRVGPALCGAPDAPVVGGPSTVRASVRLVITRPAAKGPQWSR